MKAIVLLMFPATAIAADLVGSVVPPYPGGADSRNAACVGKPLEPAGKEVCPYSVGILETLGVPTQIYAAKLSHRKEKKAYFTITDVIPYPNIAQDHYLAFGVCRVKAESDDTVLAVVRNSDDEWHAGALWAQKVDLSSGKFKTIAADGIECMNEDPGD